jgi:hypothetical protein
MQCNNVGKSLTSLDILAALHQAVHGTNVDPVALLVWLGLSRGVHEVVLLMYVGIELGRSELRDLSRVSGFARVSKQARCEGRSLRKKWVLTQKNQTKKQTNKRYSASSVRSTAHQSKYQKTKSPFQINHPPPPP